MSNSVRLLFSYIRLHIKSLFMLSVFALIFTAVFSLSSLPLDIILYCALLCLFFFIIATIIDFIFFIKKHKLLCELNRKILISLEFLPPAETIIEGDYQRLIETLYREKANLEQAQRATISQTTDYYTLWVHQIKTPIAAMRLLLQSDENANPELEEQLFKIEQYVEMVLQYIRSESDSTDYVLKKCNLDDIIKTAVKKYAKLFIKKKITLDYKETNCSILTDEKWLTFVIEQLISNALKYTPSGKISIYMEPFKTLIIEDTGIGIKPEDLPRVCEKGYTGYNGRMDKKSTGIGLHLCKRILTKLSHTLEIQSDGKSGTKVIIELGSVDLEVE